MGIIQTIVDANHNVVDIIQTIVDVNATVDGHIQTIVDINGRVVGHIQALVGDIRAFVDEVRPTRGGQFYSGSKLPHLYSPLHD